MKLEIDLFGDKESEEDSLQRSASMNTLTMAKKGRE